MARRARVATRRAGARRRKNNPTYGARRGSRGRSLTVKVVDTMGMLDAPMKIHYQDKTDGKWYVHTMQPTRVAIDLIEHPAWGRGIMFTRTDGVPLWEEHD